MVNYVGLDLQLIVFYLWSIVFHRGIFFIMLTMNHLKDLWNIKITKHKSKTTLLGMETPSMNGKHYPLPIKSEQSFCAKKYFDLMPENVYTMGRAGYYDYGIDIDDCILQGLELNDKI